MTEQEINAERKLAQEISNIVENMPEDERNNLLNIIIGYKLGIEARRVQEEKTA